MGSKTMFTMVIIRYKESWLQKWEPGARYRGVVLSGVTEGARGARSPPSPPPPPAEVCAPPGASPFRIVKKIGPPFEDAGYKYWHAP